MQLVEALLAAGMDHVEVGAFVSPKAVPAMAGADEVLRRAARALKSSVLTVLIPNLKGYELATSRRCEKRLHGVVRQRRHGAGQCPHEPPRSRRGVNAEILQQARADGVRVTSTIAVAFECPFDGPVEPGLVRDIAARFLELGTDEVGIADTIGAANPQQVRALTDALVGEHGADRISLPFS